MAATGIRCVMVVQDDVYGFTEVHTNSSVSFDQVRTRLIALFKARMALCGPPAKPYRGRMSLIGTARQVQKLTAVEIASINTTPTFAQVNGPDGPLGPNASDQPKSSVLLRAVGATGTEKSIFLAGVPDPVIGEMPAGPRVTFIPQYDNLFQAYKTRLINDGWGYVARDTRPGITKPTAIVGYSINVGTNLTGVQVIGTNADWPVNAPVQIRNVQLTNRSYAGPEGQWIVDSAVNDTPNPGTVTVYLRNSIGLQIGQVLVLGTMEHVVFTTLGYTDVYPEAQTTRKRGNRGLVGPGRRTKPKKIYL